jgi:hypothetical protein
MATQSWAYTNRTPHRDVNKPVPSDPALRVSGITQPRLFVYNTLTRKKELFVPPPRHAVRLFVCGPTVYDAAHLGHAKTALNFDFIARYLRSRGLAITYVQTITDIDDKILERCTSRTCVPSA